MYHLGIWLEKTILERARPERDSKWEPQCHVYTEIREKWPDSAKDIGVHTYTSEHTTTLSLNFERKARTKRIMRPNP